MNFPTPQPLRSRKVTIKRLPDFAKEYQAMRKLDLLSACIYLSDMIESPELNSQLTTLSFMKLDKPEIFSGADAQLQQLHDDLIKGINEAYDTDFVKLVNEL